MAEDFRFDWDAHNLKHLAQHGVGREEAEQAVTGALLDLDYRVTYDGEERWTAAGQTISGRILVVVWTILRCMDHITGMAHIESLRLTQPQGALRRSITICD